MTTDHRPPVVFGVAIALILTPLVVYIAYLLRAATIARRSVSVGPFATPGRERRRKTTTVDLSVDQEGK